VHPAALQGEIPGKDLLCLGAAGAVLVDRQTHAGKAIVFFKCSQAPPFAASAIRPSFALKARRMSGDR
jgi:hypothetical protein